MPRTNSIISVTHRNDLDGIGSAAILMRRFDMPMKNVLFGSYTKPLFKKMLQSIRALHPKNSTIIFTDIGSNDSWVKDFTQLFKELRAAGNKIFWFDHHPWTERTLKSIATKCDVAVVGENDQFCATELVYHVFPEKNDTVAKKIAELAHKTDFHLTKEGDNKLIGDLVCAITHFNNKSDDASLVRMAKELSKGKFSSPLVKQASRTYSKLLVKNKKVLLSSLKSFELGKITVGIAYASSLQSTAACDYIFDALPCDMAIYVNTDSDSAHIRCLEGLDCSPLARKLGGGGHPLASGFEVQKADMHNIKKGNMKPLIKRVSSAAKGLF